MRRAYGSARVDRIELLCGPVRAPQSVSELDELGLVRRGPDPAPQLQARGPEGVEVAGDQRQRHPVTRGHIGEDRPELLELVRETDHIEVHDINAQSLRFGADRDPPLRRDRPQQCPLGAGQTRTRQVAQGHNLR